MEREVHAANVHLEGEDADAPVVQKFGGSSMDRMLEVVDVIKNTEGKNVVVVSAFKGVTDKLIALWESMQKGNGWRQKVAEID